MAITVHLEKGKGFRVEGGHPWVFENEIARVEGEPSPGAIAEVLNCKGRFIGRGVCSPRSKIRVRLFTRDPGEQIDEKLVRSRVASAWDGRRSAGLTQNCRVVFGESDLLPGLVADKFGDVIVLQSLCAAADAVRDSAVAALREILSPRAIFERSDAPVRALEGLQPRCGFLFGEASAELTIEEPRGAKFFVDIQTGQKTGFFLDQKLNRLAIEPYVRGAGVLDAFSYTGAFAVYAALFGAAKITAVEQAAEAVALAHRNAELNGVADRIEFVAANAFDALASYARAGMRFGAVILDPPAFTKSRSNLENAARGYKEIALRSLFMLEPGGCLIASSCSHFVTPELFLAILGDAARDAGRTLRLIHSAGPPPDHPELLGVDETSYLKFMILRA